MQSTALSISQLFTAFVITKSFYRVSLSMMVSKLSVISCITIISWENCVKLLYWLCIYDTKRPSLSFVSTSVTLDDRAHSASLVYFWIVWDMIALLLLHLMHVIKPAKFLLFRIRNQKKIILNFTILRLQ